MGRVRTKTVKKSSRLVIERYYSKMTLDFHTNKKILEEVAIIPSKRLRNKIAGFSTHLMKRIQKGPVRGISLKLQEEERERRMDFVPEESAIKTDRIEVDKETIDLLASLGMSELPGIVLKEEQAPITTSLPQYGGGRGGFGGGAGGRRLQGKVAIITGGASGIGASVTQLFWDNGAKVVIADIQDILGEALANKLHQNVCYMHCDVSKEEDIINLVDTTVTKYGQLDIMYNNAGIMDRPFGGILDTPKSDLVRLLNINVVGSFLGAKQAARVMVPQRKGCILFTSSACTSIAGLSSHAYAISKYGVWGLVRNLSAELGEYGIRVNCVSPYAVINTGISRGSINIGEAEIANMENWVSERGNLKGKILKVQDIANAALYLASDEANYVSGLNLVVDGGFSVVNPSFK